MTFHKTILSLLSALSVSSCVLAGNPFANLQQQARQSIQRSVSASHRMPSRVRTSAKQQFGIGKVKKAKDFYTELTRRKKGRPFVPPNPSPQPKPGHGGPPNKTLPHPGHTILPHPGNVTLPHPGHTILPIPLPRPCPTPRPCPRPRPVPCPVPIVIHPAPRPECPTPVVVTPPTPEITPDPEHDLPKIFEGQRVSLPVPGLGETAGHVTIKLGPISAAAKVVSWGPETVVFEAPRVGHTESARADLRVSLSDGSPAGSVEIEFLPQKKPQLPQIPVGSRLTLSGNDFGSDRGQVRVQIGVIKVSATVLNWSRTSAEVELPNLELDKATDAELLVVNGGGSVVDRTPIQLVAAR